MKRSLLAYSLLLGMAASLLWLFLLIERYVKYLVEEPNPFILWAEIVMCVGTMVFAIERIVHTFRRGPR